MRREIRQVLTRSRSSDGPNLWMANFGHVAVGLLTGRLHGGTVAGPRRRTSWGTLALFVALAALPDVDVVLVALGASDARAVRAPGGDALARDGDRGRGGVRDRRAPLALAGGADGAGRRGGDREPHAARSARRGREEPRRCSGRSRAARYHLPWRLLPDAPRGLRLLSRAGLLEFGTEFALFLPVTIYALWPQIVARVRRARPSSLRLSPATTRWRRRRSTLRIPSSAIRRCVRAADRALSASRGEKDRVTSRA